MPAISSLVENFPVHHHAGRYMYFWAVDSKENLFKTRQFPRPFCAAVPVIMEVNHDGLKENKRSILSFGEYEGELTFDNPKII